uniref:Pyrin domain-containing protein n=1 Tax=Amphilophus citrinellus TaxID=61819 RepID=A0A3Q0T6J6_AMPCI
MPSEVLMDILRHLGNEEFKEYKWYLQKHDFLKDFPPIPKSRLEEADRMDTVDLMVQTYSHQYLEVNWKILRLMNRNDLLGTSDGGSGRRGEV